MAALARAERQRRRDTDFNAQPLERARGADPYDVVSGQDAAGFFAVVALRGEDAVVLLRRRAGSLVEVDRRPHAGAPHALARLGNDVVSVARASPRVVRFRVDGDALRDAGGFAVDGTLGLSGVAVRGDAVYVSDPDAGVVRAFVDGVPRGDALAVGRGAGRIVIAGDLLAAIAVQGHALAVCPVVPGGVDAGALVTDRAAVVVHDGPFWGLAARAHSDGSFGVAAAGVEDAPLDRGGGSFAFIDSFLFVFHVDNPAQGPLRRPLTVARTHVLNLSEHGVVTPRTVAFVGDGDGGAGIVAVGAGSGIRAHVRFGADGPVVTTAQSVAGAVAASGGVVVSPLLDAAFDDATGIPLVFSPPPPGRLGEALVFTTLMAPAQQSDGPLSRFTCEACHPDGGVDGRAHHTGRSDVRATTRPLWGLANNVPLFTRALDATLSDMAHAEFRVANANSAQDPWFSLGPSAGPTAAAVVDAPLPPAALRQALVDFFFAFPPPANPRTQRAEGAPPSTFSPLQRRGQAVFFARCVACHAARTVGDDPATTVREDDVERLLLRGGALVWSRPERMKTGIEPLVHEEGARPSSLRRLREKHPYFTNGSASTLGAVLERVRIDGDRVLHDGAGAPLSDDDQRALLAFLELL